MEFVRGGFVVVLLAMGLTGCATTRGVMDVRVVEVHDPGGDRRVRIARVTDSRKFEIRPSEPSVPSLKDGKIEDESVTRRAIARKRNTYGKALGDILLPEDRTLEIVVREAVTRALRESGYSVIDSADDADDSIPLLEVDIKKFWAWMTPGFWAVSLEFVSEIEISGDIYQRDEVRTARGYVRLRTMVADSGAWSNTINKGLDDLVRQTKSCIPPLD